MHLSFIKKKSVIGIGCGLLIALMTNVVIATETTPVTNSQQVQQIAVENSNVGSDINSSANSVTASPAKPAPQVQNSSSASQLASLIGGLALILVLIFGLSWFVKRFSQGGFLQNPVMKLVSSMPLGTRERLMLVDVGGKQLLLGVTATQINTLHVFDEPVVAQYQKTSESSSDFSQKLMAILQQKNFVPPNDSSHKN